MKGRSFLVQKNIPFAVIVILSLMVTFSMSSFQEANEDIEKVSNYLMNQFETGAPFSYVDAKNGISQNLNNIQSKESNLKSEGVYVDTNNKKEMDTKTLIEGIGYNYLFILLSELGDKTFLFVVLYATKMNGPKLLLLCTFPLLMMHTAAVYVGQTIVFLFGSFWLKFFSVALLFIFGLILIYKGVTEANEDPEDVLEEVKKDLKSKQGSINANITKGKWTNIVRSFIQTECFIIFTTVFLTEMGDRSQITAIAMSVLYDDWLVVVAGGLGHITAMSIAVLFGIAVSNYTTEKRTNLAGGILFLVFSAYYSAIYFCKDLSFS